jgi:hypothetical protein
MMTPCDSNHRVGTVMVEDIHVIQPHTLERLITDGRIHPGRIEEIVAKAEQEMEQTIRESGERATFDVGVHGIHPELIKMIGKFLPYSKGEYL